MGSAPLPHSLHTLEPGTKWWAILRTGGVPGPRELCRASKVLEWLKYAEAGMETRRAGLREGGSQRLLQDSELDTEP